MDWLLTVLVYHKQQRTLDLDFKEEIIIISLNTPLTPAHPIPTVRAIDTFGEWYRAATAQTLTQRNPNVSIKCKCAGDPLLPTPGCILCYCPASGKLSKKPPKNQSVPEGACLNSGKTKKTVMTPLYSPGTYKKVCKCENDPVMSNPGFRMCTCPTTVKIPTSEDYTAIRPKTTSPAFGIWPVCKANFALCSMAKCKVPFRRQKTSNIGPELAECGCILAAPDNGLSRTSYIDPAYILDKQLKAKSYKKCGYKKGSTTCKGKNSSPVCKALAKNTMYKGAYDLISTFAPSPKLGGFNTQCNEMGSYANCMTAACIATPAFDGSPVTCYCPVYESKAYAIGSPMNVTVTCTPPKGIRYSGVMAGEN